LPVVENKKEFIERLQMVISHLHVCDSTWERSAPVYDAFNGQTIGEGDVEVFNVTRPKAKEAYARSDADGNFTAVLSIPPATDPQNAVKVLIVAAAKKGKS
jgi:hypothetical protein